MCVTLCIILLLTIVFSVHRCCNFVEEMLFCIFYPPLVGSRSILLINAQSDARQLCLDQRLLYMTLCSLKHRACHSDTGVCGKGRQYSIIKSCKCLETIWTLLCCILFCMGVQPLIIN